MTPLCKFRPLRFVLAGCCAIGFATASSFTEPTLAQEVSLDSSTMRPPDKPLFLELQRVTRSEMSSADLGWITKKDRQIANEASLFGYNLSLAGWVYDQTICPLMENDIILHYRRRSQDGTLSRFTAVVPRSPARVAVVPILYHNATPFDVAAGSDRGLSVFNLAISRETAEDATRPSGNWLLYGACYADLVGGEGHVMERPGTSAALLLAPLPTLRISDVDNSHEIVFTDRDGPNRSTIWRLILNREGRLTRASTTPLPDHSARSFTPQPAVGTRTSIRAPAPGQVAAPKTPPLPSATPQ